MNFNATNLKREPMDTYAIEYQAGRDWIVTRKGRVIEEGLPSYKTAELWVEYLEQQGRLMALCQKMTCWSVDREGHC